MRLVARVQTGSPGDLLRTAAIHWGPTEVYAKVIIFLCFAFSILETGSHKPYQAFKVVLNFKK